MWWTLLGLLISLVVLNVIDQSPCPKGPGRWSQMCVFNKVAVGMIAVGFATWLAVFGAYTLTLSNRP